MLIASTSLKHFIHLALKIPILPVFLLFLCGYSFLVSFPSSSHLLDTLETPKIQAMGLFVHSTFTSFYSYGNSSTPIALNTIYLLPNPNIYFQICQSFDLHTYTSNCLFTFFIWMSNRHLKLYMYQKTKKQKECSHY